VGQGEKWSTNNKVSNRRKILKWELVSRDKEEAKLALQLTSNLSVVVNCKLQCKVSSSKEGVYSILIWTAMTRNNIWSQYSPITN
jgi:hypothetical protein